MLIHTGAGGGGGLLFRVRPFKCWCLLEPLLQIHLEIMFSWISGHLMIQPSIIWTITASFQTNGCFRASKGQSVPQNQKTLKLRSPCMPVRSVENSWALWKQIARLPARLLWDPVQISLLLRTFPPPAEPQNHLSCCVNPDRYPCWPAKSRLWEARPQQSPCLWSSWVTLSHTMQTIPVFAHKLDAAYWLLIWNNCRLIFMTLKYLSVPN